MHFTVEILNGEGANWHFKNLSNRFMISNLTKFDQTISSITVIIPNKCQKGENFLFVVDTKLEAQIPRNHFFLPLPILQLSIKREGERERSSREKEKEKERKVGERRGKEKRVEIEGGIGTETR